MTKYTGKSEYTESRGAALNTVVAAVSRVTDGGIILRCEQISLKENADTENPGLTITFNVRKEVCDDAEYVHFMADQARDCLIAASPALKRAAGDKIVPEVTEVKEMADSFQIKMAFAGRTAIAGLANASVDTGLSTAGGRARKAPPTHSSGSGRG